MRPCGGAAPSQTRRSSRRSYGVRPHVSSARVPQLGARVLQLGADGPPLARSLRSRQRPPSLGPLSVAASALPELMVLAHRWAALWLALAHLAQRLGVDGIEVVPAGLARAALGGHRWMSGN